MEVFYFVLITSALLCNIFLIKKVRELSTASTETHKLHLLCYGKIDRLQDDLNSVDEKVTALGNSLDLLSLASKAPTETPMKSFKPNNWDSMRAAFKGPTRVEINE